MIPLLLDHLRGLWFGHTRIATVAGEHERAIIVRELRAVEGLWRDEAERALDDVVAGDLTAQARAASILAHRIEDRRP